MCVGISTKLYGFEIYSPQVHLLVSRGLLHNQCIHLGEGVPASWKREVQGCEGLPHPAGPGAHRRLQHTQEVLPPSSSPRGGRQQVNCSCEEGRATHHHRPLPRTRTQRPLLLLQHQAEEARVLYSLQTVPAPPLHGQQGRRGSVLLRALAHRRSRY